jgi:hypothetical protein
MRWTEEMAEAIVHLRAVYLSGDFDSYWQFHNRTGSETPIPSRLERPGRSKVATPKSNGPRIALFRLGTTELYIVTTYPWHPEG